MQRNKKKNGYLISSILLLTLVLITLFTIFLFMHPTVYFSKASGFSQHDGVRAGKNKLRLVVPETVDTTKSTYISVKQEWFETSRMGMITGIKAKQGKHLALDFTDREYNQEVFTIYTKNWFGIKREHDVIVDYSNFLRVFFPEPNTGEEPRKAIILPYSKLKTEYKHIYEELLKLKSFIPFNEKGLTTGQAVSKEEVLVKENARGRAFLVNNDTHLSVVYDFLLPGIFKNHAQKTQVFDYIEKSAGKFTTYDPVKQGIDIKFNTAPFYISKFLGWYYIDPTGNRVDLKPSEEVLIPKWAVSELRLIARYDITTDTDKIGPELDKQGLVAVSYFDGAQRVIFDIVKKGTPFKEHIYQKEGYAYAGWYKDSALTEKVDFSKELANTHTVLYLKSIKQNQPQPEKPVKYHTVNFITPSDANQLLSTKRAHGQKLEANYLTPSLVSRLDEHGNLWELDYWNLVDPVTGTRTRFDFNTPITEDITLEAVMRKRIPLTTKYTIKRYYESVDQAANFIEDKSKEEVVDGQTPGQEVELSPTQTNAPAGFTLADGTVTKKTINKDGSTVFELKYTRERYKVNFEVNYNGNHFKDVNTSSTPEQTIPYEGKLTKPANPTLTKAGYTYTFKHWQLKDEMGNIYKEVSEFDFNTKITKNLTLVAYFEENAQTTTYTIKHVFEGVDDIAQREEVVTNPAKTNDSVTVSSSDRLTKYDHGFEVKTLTQTQTVKSDGSTTFTLNYTRREFNVTFDVNFQNKFEGSASPNPNTQRVKYEGKVKTPNTPSITKHGRTYQFIHWQTKASMNGVYSQQHAYDFSSKVIENLSLVAYFKEIIDTVNYKVVHKLEKQGKDNTLDGKYDEVTKIVSNQKVEDGAQYKEYTKLDNNLYEKDTTHPGNVLYAQLTAGDNTTEVRQYYKLKEISVEFKKTEGIKNFKTADTIKVKKTRRITLPEYELKDNYKFIGWSLSETGTTQSEFIASGNNIQVFAQTDLQDKKITYTIKTQKVDGSYSEHTETKIGKIGSNHTVSYTNPDNTVYQDPEYSVVNLTVNANETQNKVTITINRKTYTVTYSVKGYSTGIPNKTFWHNQEHGEINESMYKAEGLQINKIELDKIEKTKDEIKKLKIVNNHSITVYVGEVTRKVGKYPQTKVVNPEGIHEVAQDIRELKFNSKNKPYTMSFTRHYYKDNSGVKYEKYNGEYFKFEDVEFVKIPLKSTWFTKHIIDLTPFNIYHAGFADNAKPERSIFKAMVEEIGKILNVETFMPTYDYGEFSVKPALDANINNKLKRESTDYAKAINQNFYEYSSFYRGIDLSPFFDGAYYRIYYYPQWHFKMYWLGTRRQKDDPYVHIIDGTASLSPHGGVNRVCGVVVCIR